MIERERKRLRECGNKKGIRKSGCGFYWLSVSLWNDLLQPFDGKLLTSGSFDLWTWVDHISQKRFSPLPDAGGKGLAASFLGAEGRSWDESLCTPLEYLLCFMVSASSPGPVVSPSRGPVFFFLQKISLWPSVWRLAVPGERGNLGV